MARRKGTIDDKQGAKLPIACEASQIQPPPHRRLRVYAFDPTLGMSLDTAVLNATTLKVPWEEPPPRQDSRGNSTTSARDLSSDQGLAPGPRGEYLEVIDHDPASNCFYAPVDLNDPYLLAQDGLTPSEGNPQFHQQMVYAVAMTTISHFEKALGRKALWSPRRFDAGGGHLKPEEQWVQRLRIYPHALREPNAYYSPDKKALLFGYFPAAGSDSAGSLPGGIVFTCLSHDIIAHETTHALLDGLHRRFSEPSNADVLAFHEAFADIVALFQHFTFPDAIRHQLAKTRGDLGRQNLLGALAQQFGQALGNHGALRDSIGRFVGNRWVPHEPDPKDYERADEPHVRGAVLVAAVFDAFMSIYRRRIADLLRIASGGTGVLTQGELHPDLVNRLAAEATKSAGHVLLMCVRALDYCPPVDITFGEYLRALITADTDLVPDDSRDYRIAFVEAFRRRGIYPRDVRTLSADNLRWQRPNIQQQRLFASLLPRKDKLGDLKLTWDLRADRYEIFKNNRANARRIHAHIQNLRKDRSADELEAAGYLLGLNFVHPQMKVEVHSVRPARRVGPDGQQRLDWIIEITQWRPAWLDATVQALNEKKYYRRMNSNRKGLRSDFRYRGGCTLIVDAESGEVRYAICKNIRSDRRLAWEQAYRSGSFSAAETYFAGMSNAERFAMLHRTL